MTLLGAGLGAIQPVAQATFTNSSYSTNLSNLTSVATFSRAGNAMQFDSSGYLTYGPNNLLTQSNTFSNAAWTKSNMSVASGATDPFGTTLAWTLTATGSGALLYQLQTLAGPNAIPYVWMRRKTGTGIIYLGNANNVSIDVTAQVSSTWAFVYVAPTAALGGNLFLITLATSGDEIEIYSAGYSAVTYETAPRANDKISTGASAYYGPRFDYTYNGSSWVPAGLLVEGASTNYALDSEDMTTASWGKANATVSKTAAALFGSLALNTVTQTAGATATYLLGSTFAVSAGAYSTHTVAILAVGSKTTGTVGVLGSVSVWGLDANSTATVVQGPGSISQLGGSRWNVTGLSTTVPTIVSVTKLSPALETAGLVLYLQTGAAGSAGDKLAFGRPQSEPGNLWTSYVITGAAPVTRATETMQSTATVLSTLQGGQGTLIYEGDGVRGTSVFVGTGGSQFGAYSNGTNFITYNGTSTLSASALIPATGAWRGAVAWSAAGRAIVLNGGSVTSDANSFTTFVGAYLGSNNSAFAVNTHIRSVAFYNSHLPDATLQAKSVVGAAY